MNRLIVLAVACLAVSAEAQNIPYWPGRITGDFWREAADSNRMSYVIGVIDGFHYSAAFGADENILEQLHSCTRTQPGTQLLAIVDQYHADHPELWDAPMSRIINEALREFCRIGWA